MKRGYFQGTLRERMDHYTYKMKDCWRWTGTTDGKGYGLVWDGRRRANRYAHVVAWELEYGEPAGDRVVRHDCDTALCVRPSHLLIGTHADNVADKVTRNRQSRGSQHGIAKLTEDKVLELRALYATGAWSQKRLARHFSIAQGNVSLIVNRKAWTHI